MVKAGYTCITVPIQLYEKLKQASKNLSISIPKLIQQLLETQTTSMGTSTDQEILLNQNIESQNPSLKQQNNHDLGLFSQKEEEKMVRNRRCLAWWAGQDSNLRPPPRKGGIITTRPPAPFIV